MRDVWLHFGMRNKPSHLLDFYRTRLTYTFLGRFFLAGISSIALLSINGCAGTDTKQATSQTSQSSTKQAKIGEPIIVFSASDLRPALTELSKQYQLQYGDSITFVFGSTTALTKQIMEGAPADLFLAASVEAIDSLANQKMIVDSTRRRYASGSIAMAMPCASRQDSTSKCTPPTNIRSIHDLLSPEIRTISIADPRYAPYGFAARQALERAGMWASVEKRIVMGASVLQAWQYMTTGNADVSIVALSLVIQDSLHAYVTVDSTLYDPPLHELAVIASSTQEAAAVRFINFLFTDASQELMQSYGFKTAPNTP